PVIDDRIQVDIKESDVRVDTMRAGGAGGQHVNKTESAIRLTHIPTNIVVVCQNDRSQHRNRAQAWQMLRARLYDLELKKREEKAAAEQAAKTDIGWGHQIPSYVLQPYQMVKDLRTGATSSNPAGVLDGDLDRFMEAALAQKAFGGAPEAVEDVEEVDFFPTVSWTRMRDAPAPSALGIARHQKDRSKDCVPAPQRAYSHL